MGSPPTIPPVCAHQAILRRAIVAGAVILIGALSCGPATGPIDEACVGVECAAGEICIEGLCVLDDGAPGCSVDSDCAAGWRCEVGMCLPPESGSDACADLICDPGFLCVGGNCIAEDEAITCSTDADCDVVSTCDNGICQPLPISVLAFENPNVTFAQLVVGEVYSLVAPAPANLPDVNVDVVVDNTNVSTNTPDSTMAQKPAPATCTCGWRVEPDTAGTFDVPDSCASMMTSTSAGRFTLFVDANCEGISETFSQASEAFEPPTPCTVDNDCTRTEFCEEAFCVDRTGPVARILSDRSRAPFVVELSLRLEDIVGQPIVDGVVREQFRIFEDGVEIDYAETGYSITSAPNLPLKLFLVLDYTQSMLAAGAIDAMREAAKTFILGEQFRATHDVGLIEFHDRTALGTGFGIVQALTRADEAGKLTLANAIPSPGSLESGATRVWDAVNLALTALNGIDRQPGEERAIVFLTDGHDTTSEVLPSAILSDAQSADVMLYPIGFGDTTLTDNLLNSLADGTGGRFLPASNAASLTQVFSDLADDLRGHWTLRYVTQKNAGNITARIDFTHEAATSSLSTEVNVATLAGDPNQSIVQVLDRQFDPDLLRTEFRINVAYVPRNISQFRFFAAQDAPMLIQLLDEGLTPSSEGWRLETIRTDTFSLIGPSSLELGSFGSIGTISVSGDVAQLQVAHDDSIYDNLAQPKSTAFEGDVFVSPPRLTIILPDPIGGGITKTPDRLAYEKGEIVTLSVTPFGDFTFDKWGGAASGSNSTITLTMDADKEVNVNFFPPRNVAIVILPAGSGTVSMNPNKTTFRQGDIVELTATPVGSTFTSWSGGASGSNSVITVTIDGDKTVTANFTVTP